MNLKTSNKPWEQEEDEVLPSRRGLRWWHIAVAVLVLAGGFAYYKRITRIPESSFTFLAGHRPVRTLINEETPFLWVLYHVKRPAKELQEQAKKELEPPAWEYPERKLGDLLGLATGMRDDGATAYVIDKGRVPDSVQSPIFDSDRDPAWSYVMIAYQDPMPVWIRAFTYKTKEDEASDIPASEP